MKKFIFAFYIIAVTLLSSCSNDSISTEIIYEDVAIRITPYSVIQPFCDKHKVISDEIPNLSDDFLLRVRLMVYDEKGSLIATDEQFVANYTYNVVSRLNLALGSYQAIVITDVVTKYKRDYNWRLTDERYLNSMKITNLEKSGKERILGIGRASITVTDNTNEVVINPQPAGALLYIQWSHIHAWASIMKELKIASSRAGDCITFDDSMYIVAEKSDPNNFSHKYSTIVPNDYKDYINYVWNYSFELPISNAKLRYEEYFKRVDSTPIYGTGETVDFESGHIYYVRYDLQNPDKDNRSEFLISKW